MTLQFVIDNWYLFVALVVVVALLIMDPIRQHASGIKKVSPMEMPRVLGDHGIVVDVSDAGEYKKAHIPKALNMNLKAMQAGLGKLEKQKKKSLVVVCQTGNRAPAAARYLIKNGFENVNVLAGGMMAWQKENLPVEKG